MKNLKYHFDDLKVLTYLVHQDNPHMSKSEVESIISKSLDSIELEDTQIEVIIDENKKSYANIFTNLKTGEKYYDHTRLPINIRMLYDTLFSRLYWKYCN